MTVKLISRALVALALSGAANAQYDGSRFLWYNTSATDFNSALPIGNGRLAGMVYGSAVEKISLNENSVWSGPFQDRVPPNALSSLPTIRQLLVDENITAANQLVLQRMVPSVTSPRSYSTTGDLLISLGHSNTSWTDYSRWLDTKQGNAGVSYTYNGAKYSREFVASYPDGVLAMQFRSELPGSLNLNISLSRARYVVSQNASLYDNNIGAVDLLGNSGQTTDAIQFASQAHVVQEGGKMQTDGKIIIVTNATTVDVFYNAESSVRHSNQELWVAELKRKLEAAASKGFDNVKRDAFADANNLLGRVSLDLGKSPSGVASEPSDMRLANFRQGTSDIELHTLMYNYGRFLLYASSRDSGSNRDLPANLVGIWWDNFSPPWGGKYTININIQMNYWLAEMTNLAETVDPLFDLIDIARPRGQSMAKRMYGCDGFMFHHNLDLWGDPAPTDNGTAWTMWPMGGVWLPLHLIEHYRFTRDKDFLRDRAWPVLTDSAKFYYCYLFEHKGWLTTGPSSSPENSFYVLNNQTVAGSKEGIDIGPAMDRQLLYDLFNAILEAAEVLGLTEDEDAVNAKKFLARIKPPQIGSVGQILEWRYEYGGSTNSGHRHLSPLYGLHPGTQMTPLVDSKLAKAARELLVIRVNRGSGAQGWSRVWIVNCFARLFDGANVWTHMNIWLKNNPQTNLFNTDTGNGTAFQIDGNFGYVAGVTEALLQSQAGVIHLLPALPSGTPTGSVKGLVARGNVLVDIEWENGVLTKAMLEPRIDGPLTLRVANTSAFSVNGKPYDGTFQGTAGTVYEVAPN